MRKYTDKVSCRYCNDRLIYDIKVQDDYYVYRLGGKGKKYYFSMDNELIRIFDTYKLTPAIREDNRLIFTYRERGMGGKTRYVFAHDLAYSVYNGFVKCESFYKDMRSYFKYKGKLTVDHADGSVFNNTKSNVSLMLASINRKKGNITTKLKLPEKLVIAYTGNGYVFEITTLIDKLDKELKALFPPYIQKIKCAICTMRFYADNANDLVKQLDCITKANMFWRTPLRRKDGRWIKDERKKHTVIDDAKTSINEQRRLLSLYAMDETVFDRVG